MATFKYFTTQNFSLVKAYKNNKKQLILFRLNELGERLQIFFGPQLNCHKITIFVFNQATQAYSAWPWVGAMSTGDGLGHR